MVESDRLAMHKRDHLKRLPREFYQGEAIIHWTNTILDRKVGWLTPLFYYHFRELMTHTMFRYGMACPIFSAMPDHVHMIWMGLFPTCDQLNAMKFFRTQCNRSLERIGYSFQDQAFDHVLNHDERQETEFRNHCEYIARNPERSGLLEKDGFATYGYTSCLVPGYPELRPFSNDFWDSFDRTIAHLRKTGLMQINRSGRGHES